MLLCEVPTASTISCTFSSFAPTRHRIFSRSGCAIACMASLASSMWWLLPMRSKMSRSAAAALRFVGFGRARSFIGKSYPIGAAGALVN